MAAGIEHAGSPASRGGATVPPLEKSHASTSALLSVALHACGHAMDTWLVCVPDDDVCLEQVHAPAGQEQLMSNDVPSLHVPAALSWHSPLAPPLLPPPLVATQERGVPAPPPAPFGFPSPPALLPAPLDDGPAPVVPIARPPHAVEVITAMAVTTSISSLTFAPDRDGPMRKA